MVKRHSLLSRRSELALAGLIDWGGVAGIRSAGSGLDMAYVHKKPSGAKVWCPKRAVLQVAICFAMIT